MASLHAQAQPFGLEFQVNTETLGDQLEPALACDPSGGFVVAWASASQDASRNAIRARRFAPGHEPGGAELLLSEPSARPKASPRIVHDPQGALKRANNRTRLRSSAVC